MSVKSRILQFQQNSSSQTDTNIGPNQSSNSNLKPNIVLMSGTITSNKSASATVTNTNNSNSNTRSKINNSTSHFPLPVLNRPITNNITNNSSSSIPNNNSQSNSLSKIQTLSRDRQEHNQFNQHNHNQNRHKYQHQHPITSDLRKIEATNGNHNTVNTFYDIAVNVSVNKPEVRKTNSIMNQSPTSNFNPPVNRATKPALASKKASMTINLSGSNSTPVPIQSAHDSTNSQLRKVPSSRTLSSTSPSSAIPKPSGSSNGNLNTGFWSNGSLQNGGSMIVGSVKKSPGSRTHTPATTPTRTDNEVAFGSSSSSRLYGAMGWKEKYEESEKKRNHLVNLAQKATRDYEELRRRYHDVYGENEKLTRKFDSATNQLDSLRKASEAVYDDYYKLKKRYEAENRGKSDALTRVDQYNKENRRLKRQSAALMMQINDPTSLASAFDAVCETDSAENDKEILYLRSRLQELESKIVDLESELEKTKLAEFETQESVMLMNDSVNSVKVENFKLKEQLKQLDEENRKAMSSLEDLTFEYESLKCKYAINEEKLIIGEAELKKLLNEKNILQRQSLVFMNDAMDNRLMDALNQIGELQTGLEDQKQRFESQLFELQHQLSEKESEGESSEIETAARIKSLETEVKALRRRAESAEQKLEEVPLHSERSGLPPPPPPPLPGLSITGPPPPPPPPMPMMSMMGVSGTSLNNSLKSAMGTLRKTGGNGSGDCSGNSTPPNGVEGSPKSNGSNSQIDDVISQLKQGIKLKPTDRALLRKPTEVPQEKQDDTALDEMRSILNNLRRTRR